MIFKFKVIETVETTVEFNCDVEPTQEEILAEAAEGVGQRIAFEIEKLPAK